MYILYKKYELRDIMFGRVYLHANYNSIFCLKTACTKSMQITAGNTQHIY